MVTRPPYRIIVSALRAQTVPPPTISDVPIFDVDVDRIVGEAFRSVSVSPLRHQ